MRSTCYISVVVLLCAVVGCGRTGVSPTKGRAGALALPNSLIESTVVRPIVWSYCYTMDGPDRRRIRILLNQTEVFDRTIIHNLEAIHPVLDLGKTSLRDGTYTLQIEDVATGESVSDTFHPTNTVQIEIHVDPLTVLTSPMYMMHL